MSHLELLGYHDSGMEGWPQNDAPGSFWRTPVADAAGRLAALMRIYEPQVVVTYDENGFYGHPDHIQANRVTRAAMAECGIPAKLYYTALARSRLHGFRDIMAEAGIERPDEVQENPDFGTPDELITTTVDCSASPRRSTPRSPRTPARATTSSSCRWARSVFGTLMGSESFVRRAGPDAVRRCPRTTFSPGSADRAPEPGACAPPGEGDAGPGPVWSLRRGAGRGGAGASVGNRSDEAQRGGGDEHHRGEDLDCEGLLGEGGQPRVLEAEEPDATESRKPARVVRANPSPITAAQSGGRPRRRRR